MFKGLQVRSAVEPEIVRQSRRGATTRTASFRRRRRGSSRDIRYFPLSTSHFARGSGAVPCRVSSSSSCGSVFPKWHNFLTSRPGDGRKEALRGADRRGRKLRGAMNFAGGQVLTKEAYQMLALPRRFALLGYSIRVLERPRAPRYTWGTAGSRVAAAVGITLSRSGERFVPYHVLRAR